MLSPYTLYIMNQGNQELWVLYLFFSSSPLFGTKRGGVGKS